MDNTKLILDLAEISRGFKANRDEEYITSPSGIIIQLTLICEAWKPFNEDILPLLYCRAIEFVNLQASSTHTIIQTAEGISVINGGGSNIYRSPSFKEEGMKECLIFCIRKGIIRA